MTCRTAILLAACVALLALGGRAPAGVIIDESFDSNTVINSPQSSAIVDPMGAGMWAGGTSSMTADGLWQVVDPSAMGGMVSGDYVAEGYVNDMSMSMDGSWSSLAYFVAKSGPGWGGRQLEVSFGWQGDGFGEGLVASYGVYGWLGGEGICLESPTGAGAEGFALIEGDLMDSTAWHIEEADYIGDLDAYDYIGIAFTIGDMNPGGADPVYLSVDYVHLEAVPEPTSMLIWATTMTTVAYIRRRRLKKRRRATGPPG